MPSSQLALMQAAKKRAEKLSAKGNIVDFKNLLRLEPDGGTTNIRNVKSKHWQRCLGVEHVILTEPEQIETWLTAPAEEALKLQRTLPDGMLEIVARGVKNDEPAILA